MKSDYDVLIIGGGLAGGSLALALHGAGFRVAVVEAFTDRQRQLSPAGARALALANGTMRLFEQLGFGFKVKEKATPIKQIHISDRGHFGKTRLSAEDEGVEALGYVISARNLEDGISETLERSGVDRICPARLIGLQSGPDSVCLSLKQDEESITCDSRLVVGADGGNSTVRKLANISQHEREYQQTAIITVVKPEISPKGTAFERFTDFGPLAFLPVADGCCSVVWTQEKEDAKSIMALSESAFTAELEQAFGGWLGRLDIRGSRGAFPLKLVRVDHMVAQRVVLIGNAAHQLHPIAGQGLNLGMRDVALLAEMLSAQLEIAKDPGSAELLTRFARIRKADHDKVVGFTDSLVNIFSNNWMPLTAARNLGLLSLDCMPWAKHLVARYSMGLAGRTPRLGLSRSR